jgi:DEAD/DEAH box helicase domain-containing protein
LGGAPESVAANPANPQILSQQLLCAAHERPLTPSELERFGDSALDIADSLDRSGQLSFRAGMFFYPSHEPPAFGVNIRGAGGDQINLIVENEVLGSMERWRAMQSAHEGAVYLHRGQSFVVRSLNLEAGRAELVGQETDYYTQAIVQAVIDQRVALESTLINSGQYRVGLVGVSVTSTVLGFKRKTLDGDTVLSVEALDLPPTTFDTLAVRFDLPGLEFDEDLESQMGGVHGLEHALLAVAPLIAACDRADLGSAWYTAFPETLSPAVFVFDQTPGGVGLCEKLYANMGRWIMAAYTLLSSCECEEGCPACLMSARCEASNEKLDKPETIQRLNDLSP